MKIPLPCSYRRDGYASLAIFAIVGLVMLFLVSGIRILTDIRRELRLIEQRQIEELREKPFLPNTNRPTDEIYPDDEQPKSSD